MRIGFLSGSSGLPPAFSEYEELSNKLSELDQIESTRLGHFVLFDPLATHDSASNRTRIIPESAAPDLAKTKELATASFLKTFDQEASKGDFSILRAEGIFEFLTNQAIFESVSARPYTSEMLRELYELHRQSLPSLSSLISTFIDQIEPALFDLIWEDLKGFYSQMEETSSGARPSDPEPPFAASTRRIFLYIAPFLFWSPKVSEDIISEVSLLLFKEAYSSSSSTLAGSLNLATIRGNDRHKGLRLKASPFFVRELNPEFYAAQLEANNVDPMVADVIIDSWPGDFESLLRAAQSLSAETVFER